MNGKLTRDEMLRRKNEALQNYWRNINQHLDQQARRAEPRRHIADSPLPPAPDDDDDDLLDFDQWGQGKDE